MRLDYHWNSWIRNSIRSTVQEVYTVAGPNKGIFALFDSKFRNFTNEGMYKIRHNALVLVAIQPFSEVI